MKKFNSEKFCTDLVVLRSDSTQVKLSKVLGINRSTLSLLETGKQTPSLEMLTKVCNLTGFQANDYFVDIENNGLIYLMGTLETNDKEKIHEMLENIKIKEKYEMLSRRCTK